MNLHRTLVAAALSAFAFGAFAQAASAPARTDARQATQEARIDKGVASGKLTTREAKKLDAQQNRIDRVENRAEADGTVTKGEKAHVSHVQNKAKRDIRRQKHDRQRAASPAAQ
jgi:hypothetical protein